MRFSTCLLFLGLAAAQYWDSSYESSLHSRASEDSDFNYLDLTTRDIDDDDELLNEHYRRASIKYSAQNTAQGKVLSMVSGLMRNTYGSGVWQEGDLSSTHMKFGMALADIMFKKSDDQKGPIEEMNKALRDPTIQKKWKSLLREIRSVME